MDAVLKTLNAIASGIKTALDFLAGLIADLVEMAEMLAEGLLALPEWFNMFFPSEIVMPLIAVFSVVVIYKILGREG